MRLAAPQACANAETMQNPFTPMNDSTRLSRRNFLQRSAKAAGAALAFPGLIPASALGRNGTTPPSERITIDRKSVV